MEGKEISEGSLIIETFVLPQLSQGIWKPTVFTCFQPRNYIKTYLKRGSIMLAEREKSPNCDSNLIRGLRESSDSVISAPWERGPGDYWESFISHLMEECKWKWGYFSASYQLGCQDPASAENHLSTHWSVSLAIAPRLFSQLSLVQCTRDLSPERSQADCQGNIPTGFVGFNRKCCSTCPLL